MTPTIQTLTVPKTCIFETLYITNKLQMRHRKKMFNIYIISWEHANLRKKNNKGAESTYFELCFWKLSSNLRAVMYFVAFFKKCNYLNNFCLIYGLTPL